jgi:hypothetical protein
VNARNEGVAVDASKFAFGRLGDQTAQTRALMALANPRLAELFEASRSTAVLPVDRRPRAGITVGFWPTSKLVT